MSFLEIEPGEVTELIASHDTTEYLAQILGEDVQIGTSEVEAKQGGQQRVAGDEGEIEAAPGTRIHVHNPGDAKAEIRMTERGRGQFFDDDEQGFRFDRKPRDTIAGVLGPQGGQASPRSDAFVESQGKDVGIGGKQIEAVSFVCPARADFLHVAVDDADAGFDVTIEFQDGDGTEVVSVGPNESSNLTGGANDPVFHREAVFGAQVEVKIQDTSGGSNSIDYSIYGR
jgi:hypothetical protein